MSSRPVVMIDGANLFIRSWAAYPTMSSHGYQMGGTIGFLKTMERLASDLQPKAVYVAWEGGGSARRRALYSEYKMNRRPERLNRFYEDDIPESEENRKHQLLVLLAMLKMTPVCQLYVSDCEGDDLIAYLCTGHLKHEEKVIASSDKDLYQLLDEKTRIYSLHKKTYITYKTVADEFRVTAKNFAVLKSLCGDPGDNVPGVKGIGFKKAPSLFPVLGTDHDVLLQEIFDYCHAHLDESVLYGRILENKENVKRNWRLVYLDGSMLSPFQTQRVDNVLSTFSPKVDRMALMRTLIKEGISDFDLERFVYALNCVEGIEHVNSSKDNDV